MLSFVWNRVAGAPLPPPMPGSRVSDRHPNPDLQVRDLLSDPALRSVMGLDRDVAVTPTPSLVAGS